VHAPQELRNHRRRGERTGANHDGIKDAELQMRASKLTKTLRSANEKTREKRETQQRRVVEMMKEKTKQRSSEHNTW
jgi:hypothetical protein